MGTKLARKTSSRIGAPRNAAGNVRQDAYERLKSAIVNQQYRPGEIIGISELARDLGVSRTPIREALSVLERDFLVTLVDMRGVLIRPISVDEVLQMNQLREVIDGLAARLAAKRISDSTLASFERRFEALDIEPGGPDPERQAALSEEFHGAIAKACGNAYVQSQWEHLGNAFMRIKNHGWEVWGRGSEKAEMSRRRLKEHLAILQALSARDPVKAETAARDHIARSTADFLNHLRPSLQ